MDGANAHYYGFGDSVLRIGWKEIYYFGISRSDYFTRAVQ